MKLTDEEIGAMHNTHLRNGGRIQVFARAIESAVLERLTKVDVEPCCTNWKAGTNLSLIHI